MSSKDAHLYGVPKPKKTATQPPTAATTAFSSALSAMIAQAPKKEGKGLGKTTTSKSADRADIFKSHNKGSKKRAAADMLGSGQKHTTNSEKMAEDDWRRARRRLDEKARQYNALRRGDVEDTTEKYGVDFDKKWADRDGEESVEEDDEDDEAGSGSDVEKRVAYLKEKVTFKDEFNRTRTTTRAELMRLEKQDARAERAAAAIEEDRGLPSAPTSVIYGDAIQHHAFNPDEEVARRMAAMAANRDRPATPPPETYYDATKEMRTRGTGFYQFSQDAEERRRELAELAQRREETERARGEKSSERDALRQAREEEAERRRQAIRDKKQKSRANDFLDGLAAEMTREQT